MINPNEYKLEVFLKQHVPNCYKNEIPYVHYDNKYIDAFLYYDHKKVNEFYNVTDNNVANILLNMSEKEENALSDEEICILNFTQVFNNHSPLFVHPSTYLYHANMLFNSVIDK